MDYNKYNKQGLPSWSKPSAIAIIVIIIIAVIGVTASNDTLQAPTSDYNNSSNSDAGNSSVTDGTSSQPQELFSMNKYTGNGYEVSVPTEWEKVVKDGYDTFIHVPTSASVQLINGDYNPVVNCVTQNSLQKTLQAQGFTLLSFAQTTTSSYEAVYKDADYTYMEFMFWTQDKIVNLYCTVPSQYFETFGGTYMSIVQSFRWADTETKIPQDIAILYSEVAKFQMAVPLSDKWGYAQTDNTIIVQNTSDSVYFSVTGVASTEDLSALTQVQYVQIVSQNYKNFFLKSFTNDKGTISSVATYQRDNTTIYLSQYIISTGNMQYTINYEVPADRVSDFADEYTMLLSYFRFFS